MEEYSKNISISMRSHALALRQTLWVLIFMAMGEMRADSIASKKLQKMTNYKMKQPAIGTR